MIAKILKRIKSIVRNAIRNIKDTCKIFIAALMSFHNRKLDKKYCNKKFDNVKIVYLDLGLHKEGKQLLLVNDWFKEKKNYVGYGFEANPVHFEMVQKSFSSSDVYLFNLALVGPDYTKPIVPLYVDVLGDGKGDTIYKQRSEKRGYKLVKVKAKHLSDIFYENNIDFKKDIIFLRMNIEGSEVPVLEDLIEAGIINYIDGFYGKWNDAYKIDKNLGKKLDEIRKQYNISNVSFNDGDIEVGIIHRTLRLLIVKNHMLITTKRAEKIISSI